MGRELSLRKAALWTGGGLAVVLVVTLVLPRLLAPGPLFQQHLGKDLPDISITDENQKSVALRDLTHARGGPPKTILALWATWCEPCTRELPELERLRGKFAERGYRLVLVNYDGGVPDKTIPEVKAWLLSQKLHLTTYFDFRTALLDAFGVSALPFAMRVDEAAKVQWMQEGLLDWSKVELP